MQMVYIGLGSNLSGTMGEPKEQLEQALKALENHSQITLVNVSSNYKTKAIGPGSQPDYINAAALIKTQLEPLALLDQLQLIEQKHERERSIHWGARTLDLDMLMYGTLTIEMPRLTIPHPRIRDRAFVLAPLLDLDPNLSLPEGQSIAKLLANCPEQGIFKL
ncbi:MAG: 2-amino-4-hydroxy-6-hydroxymethyldihydropteridine diphosphokinase [Porticoccaceae bacterium]|jgi:2-amino-4-hydroxy-6-hydroxymethyldihydropteridine diphosphokinase|nr:2-amino-4-hydroxy-6-hydroxymethyldihydropteridine diphosphokinase [Porticoccaceae bacterium]MBT3797784.1 2-amino-4-hydroxy-6-hydroxymethyldihydropteridine diphosphokinase [Porticoccaceae bacterium]MBT4210968.1 2-amino-4-hydroxy-6-hydroxymethyldihydropteridine diphosphokinase [Porticoccaceae bacterium]MBT4591148.1 2-amino-4-hydroxy-6-hydroxymethyldihydropteridine diphosphokinase [Porticoccaceae bacterium]MBT5004842.1 2-amino-4-hydroxy-6-hydroxymethyldihydropteridine diphosphokinase [Porticocc